MRIFERFPKESKCPICLTNKEGKGVLIGKQGTDKGNTMKAECFHLDCIELTYYSDMGIIAQKTKNIHRGHKK